MHFITVILELNMIDIFLYTLLGNVKKGVVKKKEYEATIKTTLKQVLLDVDKSRFSSLSILFGEEYLLKNQIKVCCDVLNEDILVNIKSKKSSIEILRLLGDIDNIERLSEVVINYSLKDMKQKKN